MILNLFQTLHHFAELKRLTRQRRHFGVTDLHAALHANGDVAITHQTMVSKPGKLRLHLAVGRIPASLGELKVMDLEPYLHAA